MAAPIFDWLNGDVLEQNASQRKDAVIVYFHGGGYIVGSPLTHADITTELGRRTGLALYSVDYRLAPEFVAPAPIEDGHSVIDHLVRNGTRDIILCGDSAGGSIALAVEASLPSGPASPYRRRQQLLRRPWPARYGVSHREGQPRRWHR